MRRLFFPPFFRARLWEKTSFKGVFLLFLFVCVCKTVCKWSKCIWAKKKANDWFFPYKIVSILLYQINWHLRSIKSEANKKKWLDYYFFFLFNFQSWYRTNKRNVFENYRVFVNVSFDATVFVNYLMAIF